MVRILLLLCRLDNSALYTSEQVHTRMPFTLLAAMPMPMPVPQMRMPRSHSPSATALAAR